ncbi:MAG TPA: DUF4157 domain-containing protein [Thermoanaerobaculia bacterium]
MYGLESKKGEDSARSPQQRQGKGGLDNPRTLQLAAMEDRANQRPQVRETAQLQEKLNAPNTTGMSDELKTGLEGLSGMDLSGVRVHYNSPEPAQLQAHAFTQGQDIHVAPGQERHVPHEGWHVVQQMQGRVQPTTQVGGTDVNDSPALETEADAMGARASRVEVTGQEPLQRMEAAQTGGSREPVQRAMGLEFETGVRIRGSGRALQYHDLVYRPASGLWQITVDDPAEDGSGVMEFVTRPFENDGDLLKAMKEIEGFVAAIRANVSAERTTTISELVSTAGLEGFAAADIRVGGPGFTLKNLQARPQMTLGVPLERMNDVMLEARSFTLDEWATQHGEIPQTTLEADPTSIMHRATAESDPVDVAVAWGAQLREDNPRLSSAHVQQLVGFTSLVLRYLNDGYFNQSVEAAPYAKSYFPVMARTDFHSMWKSLPRSMRDLFTPEAVLKLWGYSDSMIKEAGRRPDYMFRRGYQEGGAIDQGPTVYDWLLSITNPKAKKINTGDQKAADDRLIAHYKGNDEYEQHVARARNKDLLSRGRVAFNSVSMGLWGMDRDMALLEFRGFPEGEKGGLAPRFWTSLARRLFSFAQRTTGRVSSEELARSMPAEDLRRHVSQQLDALASTQDDEFNLKVLAYRKGALESLAQVDVEELPGFVQSYNKTASTLLQEYYSRSRSRAPQLPDFSLLQPKPNAPDALREATRMFPVIAVDQIDGLYKGTSDKAFRKKLMQLKREVATRFQTAKSAGTPEEAADLLGQTAEFFAAALLQLRAEFFKSEKQETTAAKPDESVAEGGNCLFDSVSQMLEGNPDSATLRQRTTNEVRLHPLRYVDRLIATGEHDDVMVEMAAAADFLAVNNNWDHNAGEIAPLALANALRRRIRVYNVDGSLRTVVGFFNEHLPVSVFYDGWNHYMPMA